MKGADKAMNKLNRVWAKQFSGTIQEFISQAEERGLTDRSIKYWVKYNWNISI